ncbi:MAG: M20/M25/M40 family metallo-hydrolase [Phycisphaerales bacterium]|jgi:hypothetical protein
MNLSKLRISLGMAAASIPLLASAQPAAPTPAASVSKDRLVACLSSLPTSRAALGDAASRAGLVKTEDLLLKQLTDQGLTPVTQEFKWALPARNFGDEPSNQPGSDASDDKPHDPDHLAPRDDLHTWRNFILDLPGTDLANEVLVISAHMDAVPGAPGADDDGTGVAAIIELARIFSNTHHRRTIRLCLFNLEEVGLIGSTKYMVEWSQSHKSVPAAQPADTNPHAPTPPNEKIIGMVSLEMLGYFSDAPNSQKSPIPAIKGVFEPPTVGDGIVMVGLKRDAAFIDRFTQEMAKAAPKLKVLTLDFFTFPLPDIMRSDHRGFVLAGLPGAMLTDTANFRNPHYHQPTDTIDTLDLDRFTLVVQGVAGALDAIAEPAKEEGTGH